MRRRLLQEENPYKGGYFDIMFDTPQVNYTYQVLSTNSYNTNKFFLEILSSNGTFTSENNIKGSTSDSIVVRVWCKDSSPNFYGLFREIKTVPGATYHNLDFSHCNSPSSCYAMFYKNTYGGVIDLSSLDMTDTSSIYIMFNECNLTSCILPSSSIASKITSAQEMFGNAKFLTTLKNFTNDLFPNLTNLYGTFYNCNNFDTQLFVNSFNFVKITNMFATFYGTKTTNESTFVWDANLPNVTTLASCFAYFNAYQARITLSIPKCTNVSGFIKDSKYLEHCKIKFTNSDKVTNLHQFFHGCMYLQAEHTDELLELSSWNSVSDVSNFCNSTLNIKGICLNGCAKIKNMNLIMSYSNVEWIQFEGTFEQEPTMTGLFSNLYKSSGILSFQDSSWSNCYWLVENPERPSTWKVTDYGGTNEIT